MDHLKILFISDHGGDEGGAERSMLGLVKELIARGHRIFCILPSQGSFFTELKSMGVVCRKCMMPVVTRSYNPFYLLFMIFYLFLFGIRISFYVRRKGIRIIHANKTTSIFYAMAASVFSWRTLVWHARSYNRRFGLLGRLIYRFTDEIICISRDLAEPFIKYFGNKKVHIVYNGIDVAPLAKVSYNQGALAQAMGIRNYGFVAGVAGRITPCKRIETFLKAIMIAGQESHTSLYGVIIGDCITSNPVQMKIDRDYKEQLHDLVRKWNIENRIKFIGFQTEPEHLVRELDVLVLPSTGDPFGRILIEAMALGVPVIAARAGGIPEIVIHEKSGFLFTPDDAEELAQYILLLLNDPLLRCGMGKAGWERAAKHFSNGTCADRVEKIYRKALNRI